jgi:hypothetical protein
MGQVIASGPKPPTSHLGPIGLFNSFPPLQALVKIGPIASQKPNNQFLLSNKPAHRFNSIIHLLKNSEVSLFPSRTFVGELLFFLVIKILLS